MVFRSLFLFTLSIYLSLCAPTVAEEVVESEDYDALAESINALLLDEHTREDLMYLPLIQKIYEIPYSGQLNINNEEPAMLFKHIFDPHLPLPKWATDFNKVIQYYAVHQEGRTDRLIRYLACRLGIIVHGNINQQQLESHLNTFDIQKLLAEGPYPHSQLSQEAQELIYDSLQLEKVLDIHLHGVGLDEGNYLNPTAAAFGIASWMDYFKFAVLRYAAGISSPEGSTAEARKRLQLYAHHFPKFCGLILPIHKAILPDGSVDWKNTGNYLNNRSARQTALLFSNSNSELFPAVSVHPFDKEWKAKLTKAYEKGIRLIKWLPPQSIPPDSDQVNEYYDFLREKQMILIAHSGPEHTISTTEDNKIWEDWGNPLRFRKPLEGGVNVILAHCGHRDLIPDLDHPDHPLVPGYQLFLRLAREAYAKNQTGEWSGKLFGDLAAVTTHYGPSFISELLKHANEEGIRIVYGSDYPFTNLIQLRKDAYDLCTQAGLLDPNMVKPLKEIRSWNPLLANYVFTKNLELTMENGKKVKFPESTFTGKFNDVELKLIDPQMWDEFKINFEENNNSI